MRDCVFGGNPTTTNVTIVTSPSDNAQSPNYDQAREELREGLESSREMVRQTRELIELSECYGCPANDNDDCGIAN